MTASTMLFTFLIIIAGLLHAFETDADSLGSGPALEEGVNSVIDTLINIPREFLNPPENKNSSIAYRVYTPRNPKTPCFLEPTQKFLRNCPINPSYLTIFLIHGFIVDLNPGNLYEVMKDVLLEKVPSNVVIVDWTKYDGPPYDLAIRNVYIIGAEIASLIKFLAEYAGISTENVIVIGHSLGAHMAGAVGNHTPHLKRIDGLDPAGPYFETPILSRLSYADANFVQIIHTSNIVHGMGLEEAAGHMDFYVNGGKMQPHCVLGRRYRRPSGDTVEINTFMMRRFCNHEIAIQYYINAINSTDCKFYSAPCDSYDDFTEGKCPRESSQIGVMGVYGAKITDLPLKSKFYLRTGEESPYCLKDGYKPEL